MNHAVLLVPTISPPCRSLLVGDSEHWLTAQTLNRLQASSYISTKPTRLQRIFANRTRCP